MSEPKGQKLIKLQRDHYYYDSVTFYIYYIRKVKGETIKFSTGIKYEGENSLVKASRIVSVREKEVKAKTAKRLGLNKLMSEHLDDFITRSEKKGDKPGTLESKQNSVKHLKEYFGNHLPNELTPSQDQENDPNFKSEWLLFVEHFQSGNPGYNMFNLTKHFRSVVKYLHDQGFMTKKPHIYNPFKKKEDIKRKKKRYRPYEPEEITLMDAACNSDQRLALWLGYNEAFRLDDCVKLNWERVHLSKTAPYIEFHGDENKTGFTGKVPLSDDSAWLLRERRATTKGPWVFPLKGDPSTPMLSQAIKFEDVVRDSKVTYGSHHILRHTRLTEDFGNPNLPDSLVMKIRRVSLAVALEHYIHPSESDFEKFRNTGRVRRK